MEIFTTHLKPTLKEVLEVLMNKRSALSNSTIKPAEIFSNEMALNLVHLLLYSLNYLTKDE